MRQKRKRKKKIKQEYPGELKLGKFLKNRTAHGLALVTIQVDKVYLRQFLKFIRKNPDNITMEDIENWRYEMKVVRKYQDETIHKSLMRLRVFFKWRKNRIWKKLKPIKRVRKPEKQVCLIPKEQIIFLDTAKKMGPMIYAIVRSFLRSGVRVIELYRLDIDDVDLENLVIHIRHGKGNKERYIPIDIQTAEAIQEYFHFRKPACDGSRPLFTSNRGTRLSTEQIRYYVKECGIKAGIEKNITCHPLRHTFITHVIEVTKDIALAQRLAGHSNISQTMHYHHTTYKEDEIKYRRIFDYNTEDKPLNPELLYENYPKNEVGQRGKVKTPHNKPNDDDRNDDVAYG